MAKPRESDESNFGWLFAQHQTRIYGYIRSLVTNRADAEDLYQETAAVLWQKFSEFQIGTNFLAWAMSIARFQVMRFYRRQKHDILHFSENCCDLLMADTVAESARLADLQQLLDECMQKLPKSDRDVLVLRYKSDATLAKLANQLGRPLSTIYDVIRRARRVLVDCVSRGLDKEERP